MDVRIALLKSKLKHTAEQIRILRRYEKSIKSVAQYYRESQSSKCLDYDAEREETYLARKELGQIARYEGLAKAFALKKDYARIETKTRDNNKPKLLKILTQLDQWGFDPDVDQVKLWLEA
jgi:hypothetical protein